MTTSLLTVFASAAIVAVSLGIGWEAATRHYRPGIRSAEADLEAAHTECEELRRNLQTWQAEARARQDEVHMLHMAGVAKSEEHAAEVQRLRAELDQAHADSARAAEVNHDLAEVARDLACRAERYELPGHPEAPAEPLTFAEIADRMPTLPAWDGQSYTQWLRTIPATPRLELVAA